MRGIIKYSGTCAVPLENDGSGSRITFLLSYDVAGSVPDILVWTALRNYMLHPSRMVSNIKLEAQGGEDEPDGGYSSLWQRNYENMFGQVDASAWKGIQDSFSEKRKAIAKATRVDQYVEAMPTDLSLKDMIIDNSKHKTIAEQRAFYVSTMYPMCREGKENGWILHGRTKDLRDSEQQINIFMRRVNWSLSPQFRSTADTTSLGTAALFRYICDGLSREQESYASRSDVQSVFWHQEERAVTTLQYRTIPFPWPLAPRDLMCLLDCFLVSEGEARDVESGYPDFLLYYETYERPWCSSRQGFVRGKTRFQGLVGTKIEGGRGSRLTCLGHVDFNVGSGSNLFLSESTVNPKSYNNCMVSSNWSSRDPTDALYQDLMAQPRRQVLGAQQQLQNGKDRDDEKSSYSFQTATDAMLDSLQEFYAHRSKTADPFYRTLPKEGELSVSVERMKGVQDNLKLTETTIVHACRCTPARLRGTAF